MDHYTDPPGKMHIFFWTQIKAWRLWRWFSFSLGWFLGSVFGFGGVTNTPSNPWGIPRSWAHQTHVYAILRSKEKTSLYTNKMKQTAATSKLLKFDMLPREKNTTRSFSVGSSNWVPPTRPPRKSLEHPVVQKSPSKESSADRVS